jgi:hypothetical protein
LSPLFYLLVALAAAALTRRARPLAVVSALALLSLLANQLLPGWPNQELGEHLRPIVRWIEEEREPGDSIYVYYGAVPAFRVYHPGEGDHLFIGEWLRGRPAADFVADLDPLIAGRSRIWLAASHFGGTGEVAALDEALRQRCRPIDRREEPGAVGALYDCRPPG